MKLESISAEELCKMLPGEFKELLEYSRGLLFTEKPNYVCVRSLFEDL